MSQTAKSPRVTLTKAHLSTAAGRQLVELILELGIDGEFSNEDLIKLHGWLVEAPQDIPAVRYLVEAISSAAEDEFVSPEERALLHRQIERVLPADARQELKSARVARENSNASEDAARRARQEHRETQGRAEETGDTAEDAGASASPTEAQLRYIANLGGKLPIGASRGDAGRLIENLLRSNASITPRQWMVIRFWNQSIPSTWGRAQVSRWMDEWYQGDPDRQVAWELFKEERGDVGRSLDYENVPLGCGHEYLKRIKKGSARNRGPGCLAMLLILAVVLVAMTVWLG